MSLTHTRTLTHACTRTHAHAPWLGLRLSLRSSHCRSETDSRSRPHSPTCKLQEQETCFGSGTQQGTDPLLASFVSLSWMFLCRRGFVIPWGWDSLLTHENDEVAADGTSFKGGSNSFRMKPPPQVALDVRTYRPHDPPPLGPPLDYCTHLSVSAAAMSKGLDVTSAGWRRAVA